MYVCVMNTFLSYDKIESTLRALMKLNCEKRIEYGVARSLYINGNVIKQYN